MIVSIQVPNDLLFKGQVFLNLLRKTNFLFLPEVVIHLSKALLYGFVHRSWWKLRLNVDPENMIKQFISNPISTKTIN